MYGCSVAGLMLLVVWLLTLVNVTTPLTYGKTLVVQEILDGIMPKNVTFSFNWINVLFS